MPGIFDPFNPGPVTDPTAGVDPETFTRVRSEWEGFLANPQGRAALLNAGLSLMQPPSFGDNPASQIGRAVGAGGESATRNQAMDLKEAEASSKDEARQAQAEARLMGAEARASAAGARKDASGARLELQGERLRQQMAQSQMANKIKLSVAYQNYVKEVAKRNDPISLAMRPGAVPEPVLPINEWIKSNPMLRNTGLLDSGAEPDDDVAVPPGADTTSKSKPATTLSAQDQQALQWANANPTDPRAAKIKARLGM